MTSSSPDPRSPRSPRSPIVSLPEPVISGIAAGEIAERPAAIVKELVENALDAGARHVAVDYDDGATTRIVVSDDGHGIGHEELELAVTAHATSKLRCLEDLARVTSFGFRGEALASIAAVSCLDLISRTSQAQAGGRIRVKAGKVLDLTSAGARPGTRVTVSDLFADLPARRKFLKSAQAEYALAAEALKRFALARPDVQLKLAHNGKVAFDYAAVADLPARLRQVYGAEAGAAMVGVDTRHAGLRLAGAVSPAGLSFGSARRISIFVNGRWVHDRALFRSVMEAYRTYLLKGRYPAVALFLEVDPSRVDVNVHPAKTEVRFSDAALIERFLVESIRDTLRAAPGPLGRWGLTERDVLLAEARRSDRRPPHRTASAARRASEPAAAESPAAEVAEPLPGYTPASVPAKTSVQGEQSERPLPLQAGRSTLELDVVGQVLDGYIVCQGMEEMILIDQHAMHERVLYERLLESYGRGGVESQPLLVAATVNVGGEAVEAVERHAATLAALGWHIEPFGEEDVVVRAVPALAAGADLQALVERLTVDLVATGAAAAAARIAEQTLATVACHSAVRVGKPLDRQAARALLVEAETVDFSASCPHGRPVAHTMSRAQVERLFGR